MDLKTTNSNTNKNSIDNEKSTFERFESEMKNTIFGVLFVLLKEDESNIWWSFAIAIIQFLQLLIFPFHVQINGIWNSPTIVDGIRRVLDLFQLSYYFKNTNWDVYVIMFYLGIFIVCLVILDVFYVSYSYTKKKFAFVWPLHALRSMFSLFVTILFLPLLDYFISVLGCVDNGKGELVHAFFTEIKCWSGIHILHAVLSILVSLIFVLITLTVSITYFECRSTSNDPTARVNARANFLFIFYEMVMIISFTFMYGEQYQYILLALILAGSIILFMKFHFNSPYYNETIAKLWSALMSINLWTAMMLVFSKIMENTLFEGSVIAWMIGIPFIVLIVITNRDHRIDLLLINVNKFQNGQEIQNQIRYILKLISWQSSNRNAAILLDGYIEIHKQTCNKDDCPLKQKQQKNNRMAANLMKNDENLSEKYALLIQLLYKMYFYGIKKFPNNTSLRISYAFFLLEKMNSKQQAHEELNQAEQNKPPFDEQFIIYRYKKIIDDEIAESQNEETGGLDSVSENAFQNHLRQCQANIEKSALLHMEFWSQLSEDNPDLAKLNDIGSKINSSVAHVEEHWNKLQKINSNTPKAMRMYGKFLNEIINNREEGDELVERAKSNANNATNRRAFNMVNMNGNEEFNNESTPTVFISGESDKFAIITGINLAAASLFGYNKTELINRKVNVLMPQVYGKFHDQIIEHYMNNNESKLANTNKDKFVFGKNKSSYIFPVFIMIRAVSSIVQGVQFIATFKPEKNLKNAAYILTQPDGSIDSLTSTCINLLKLDNKMVVQKKGNVGDFVPNIIKNRAEIFTTQAASNKAVANVEFQYPENSEYWVENGEMAPSTTLSCTVADVIFLSGKEHAGTYFKFEKLMEKSNVSTHLERKARISNFQFRYERGGSANIIGEYVDGSTSDLTSAQVDHSEYNDDYLANSALRSDMGETALGGMAFSETKTPTPLLNQQVQQPAVAKIQYEKDITTHRLYLGKVGPIDDHKPSEDNEDDEGEGSENSNGNAKSSIQNNKKQEEDNEGETSVKDFNTTFKSRRNLNQVINDRRPPSSIRNLKWTANLLMLSLVIIAAVDYFITVGEFEDIEGNLNLINLANQRVAELQNVVSKVRDLQLLNMGVFTDAALEAKLKAEIEVSTTAVKDILDTLQLEQMALSPAHLNLLQANSINMQFKIKVNETNDIPFNLNEATLQVISKALNVKNARLSTINSQNSDVYFVNYNNFNDFYMGLRRSSDLYVTELIDRANSKQDIFMILLIVSAIALIVAMVVLFPVLFKVNRTREEVLSLFLDIPEKNVKRLYTQCENFISNLQVGEDDDMLSELDDDGSEKPNEDGETQDFHPRKKRKKFKNSGKSQRKFFIKFFMAACIVEAYFIANFFLSKDLLDEVNSIIKEVNSTSVAESFYSFVNNAERQLMIDNKFPILKQSSLDVAVENIKMMYYLDSEIHQEHSVNIKIHSDEYKEYFNKIMMLNPCQELASTVDEETCKTFADGAVFQGMAVALTRHFENLRYLLILYVKYQDNPNADFEDKDKIDYVEYYTPESEGNNKQKNNWLNILKLPQALEIDTTQHVYIKETMRILMDKFKAGMDDKFASHTTRRVILFIFFYLLLAIAYLFLWVPLVSKLSKDIWRTKSMLTMIPITVVAKIKSVRVFLKKFWNERGLSNY